MKIKNNLNRNILTPYLFKLILFDSTRKLKNMSNFEDFFLLYLIFCYIFNDKTKHKKIISLVFFYLPNTFHVQHKIVRK